MVDFTPRNGFRIPELSDQPRITDAVGQFASDSDKRSFSIYDTPAARDLANPTPEPGNVCFVASYGLPMMFYTSYWGFFPGTPVAVIYLSVPQSVPNSTITPIVFDSEEFDLLAGHDAVNLSRYTPPVPGRYMVHGGLTFVANGTGIRSASFRKNGTTLQIGPQTIIPAFSAERASISTTSYVTFNGTTDYVELVGVQSSGGNLATSTFDATAYPTMQVTYSGAA